ncbi:MAG TPA: hypothetical protein VG710_02885 [Opitutus sp.]|nr:hypothetical protein [Opitutus sp.]
MRGWVGDTLRMAGALWYWNARKSVFVLRGRRGQAPCQHPSDSGKAFETACEAAAFWRDRSRFARRVCPLLKQNAKGAWVCSVDAARVRPFWGRTLGCYGIGTLTTVLLLGLAAYCGGRVIGYRATLRQVFWPPAWKELREVRADYFLTKAQALVAKGQVRDAALALLTAREINPGNYAIGMNLAQFYQVWRRDLVDRAYADLLAHFPKRHAETANAWLHSLLARSELEGVAVLAQHELADGSGDPAPWTYALIFAARELKRPDWLDAVARSKAPERVRALLELETRVQRAPPDEARRLLSWTPPVEGFPLAAFEQIEGLIDLGDATSALVLLRGARASLTGRDVAKLALASYAVAGDVNAVRREGRTLLAPTRGNSAGVALVALHLIKYPDAELLRDCVAALQRAADEPPETRADTIVAVYFAAVCGGQPQYLPELRARLAEAHRASAATLQHFEEIARGDDPGAALRAVLPVVQPMTLELNYALIAKAYAWQRPRAARGR